MMGLLERITYLDRFIQEHGTGKTIEWLMQSDDVWAAYFIEYVDNKRARHPESKEVEYKWVGGLGL